MQLNPSPVEMFYISNVYYELRDIKEALKTCFECEKLGF